MGQHRLAYGRLRHGMQTGRHVRRIDLMAADGTQEPVGCMGHMTVIAEAAAGIGGMARMPAEVLRKCFMTLQAGLIAAHGGLQLVVRPLLQIPAIVAVPMELMA